MTRPLGPGRVLHVLQDTAADARHRHLGSTKGIRCRTDYFMSRGVPFDELVTERSPDGVLRAVRQAPLDRYAAVVFEHSHSPVALRWVRRQAPGVRIVLSTHNAEFFHRLDIVRADGLSLRLPSHVKQLVAKTVRDVQCGRMADAVVTVSQWEVEHYWQYIVGSDRVRYMPWHMPESYMREIPAVSAKRNQCISLLSTIPNPLILDAARRFAQAVQGLSGRCGDWEFLVTGDPAHYPLRAPARLQWTGLLDSPYPLLAESRAMALLSDYGYGFKTKILEAILTRTYVILSPGLYDRLPAPLRPYCFPVAPGSPDAFAAALDRATAPFPTADVNGPLREEAFRVLDDVLRLREAA